MEKGSTYCPACKHPVHAGRRCTIFVCKTSTYRTELGLVTEVDSHPCNCTTTTEAPRPS